MPLTQHLTTLETAGLVRRAPLTPELEYLFRHALVQEAAYGSLLKADRKQLHLATAETLERLYLERTEEWYGVLAHHYLQAEAYDRALPYLSKSARQAQSRYANVDAIRLYTLALGLLPSHHPDRFELLLARATVYDVMAERAAQQADITALLALAEHLNDDAQRCDAQFALADSWLARDTSQALPPIQRALELARALHDPMREGRALQRLGVQQWEGGDLNAARPTLEAAAQKLHTANLPAEAAACWHNLCVIWSRLGQFEAAVRAAEKALALSQQAGDKRQIATSLRRLAVAYSEHGEMARALPIDEAALALHRALGDRHGECRAQRNRGITLTRLGRLAEGLAEIEASFEVALQIDAHADASTALDTVARVRAYQGDLEGLLVYLEAQIARAPNAWWALDTQTTIAFYLARLGQYAEAIERAEAVREPLIKMFPVGEIWHLQFVGRCQLELGQWAAARHSLETSLTLPARSTLREAMALSSLAHLAWRVAQDVGTEVDLTLAYEQATHALQLVEDTPHWEEWGEALYTVARLELGRGRPEVALAHAQRADPLLELDRSLNIGGLWTHAHILRQVGQPDAARAKLQQAHERVMLVADQTPSPHWRQGWLEKVWFNRQVEIDWKAL